MMFDDPAIPDLDCNGRRLRLDRPRIVGVVNVTPDSFSDGGRHVAPDDALAHALRLVDEGADLLDVGGESTRPGAAPVGDAEELDRVLPVVERLVAETDLPVSIDTSKPAVMRAAVAAGAGLINDVRGLRSDGALEAAAGLGVPVVLMHMQGEPGSMQDEPAYADVVADVHGFFAQRLFACEMAGIPRGRIVLDPGFGFGKTLDHNLALLAGLERFLDFGCPLMVGLSRKRMIGELTGRDIGQRATGSAMAALIAVQRGARLVRVHDVAATADALAVWAGIADRPRPGPAQSARAPRWPDED